jgi:hypothetical protein
MTICKHLTVQKASAHIGIDRYVVGRSQTKDPTACAESRRSANAFGFVFLHKYCGLDWRSRVRLGHT